MDVADAFKHMVMRDSHVRLLRLNLQRNYEVCVNKKCLDFQQQQDTTPEAVSAVHVEECVRGCEGPLRRQQEYVVK